MSELIYDPAIWLQDKSLIHGADEEEEEEQRKKELWEAMAKPDTSE